MVGLRERKKEKTREAILETARQLFSEDGFATTTMEQVAARADVGVGTLYNYFKSKNLLLLALADDATTEMLAKGASVVAAPDPDPISAVGNLLVVYCDIATMLDKPLMRELIAVSFGTARDLLPDLMQLDMLLVSQLSELLTALRARGDIDRSLELNDAALMLYGGLLVPIMMFVSTDELDVEGMHSMVRSQAQMSLHGLLPREQSR